MITGLALVCMRMEQGATGDKLAIKTKSGRTQSPNLMCLTTAMVGQEGRYWNSRAFLLLIKMLMG